MITIDYCPIWYPISLILFVILTTLLVGYFIFLLIVHSIEVANKKVLTHLGLLSLLMFLTFISGCAVFKYQNRRELCKSLSNYGLYSLKSNHTNMDKQLLLHAYYIDFSKELGPCVYQYIEIEGKIYHHRVRISENTLSIESISSLSLKSNKSLD